MDCIHDDFLLTSDIYAQLRRVLYNRGFPYSEVMPVFNTQRQTFKRDGYLPSSPNTDELSVYFTDTDNHLKKININFFICKIFRFFVIKV